ncbi:MAG: autotransporter outer membrane beta-barrel domain-containing protein, partial [Pseudomonadota bacterium]
EDAAGAANTDGATAIDTAVVDFSVGVDQVDQDGLVASGDSTIDLLIAEIDFSIDGMTRNQQAVGDHINAILTGDGVVTTAENTLTQLFALIANKPLGEEDAVIDLIDRLTTEGYAATQVDTLFAADRFADAQFDCERRTEVRFDLETGECLWMQFEGAFFDRDDSFQFKPIDSRSFRYAGGVQVRLDETWRLGVSGAYEVVTLEMGERFRGLGDRGHFGVTARYQKSGFDLGFGVSGGYGVFDSRRRIGIDETVASQDSARLTIEQADVDQAITTGMARLSAKWRGETADGRFYLEPQIDLDATYVHSHDATEQNAGQVGVALDGGGQFIFAGSPAIEAGAKFVVHDAAVFRPFVRAGFTAFSDDEMHVDAFLIGAPASAGSFRNRSGFDQLVGEGAVGFVLEDPQLGLHFALGYDVLLGRDTQQHGVRATLGVRF